MTLKQYENIANNLIEAFDMKEKDHDKHFVGTFAVKLAMQAEDELGSDFYKIENKLSRLLNFPCQDCANGKTNP